MMFVILFVLAVFSIWILPEKLYKFSIRFGKRFIRKQIKHELRRFKP